jgi:hypothetical protein
VAKLFESYGAKSSALEQSLGRAKCLTQTSIERPNFFSLNNQSLTKSWPLDSRGYFEQRIKWHAALSLDFGLGLWRLHTMPGRRLHLLYFIGYFKLISLNSQQSLATQSHGLSTWTAGHSVNRPSVTRPLLNGPDQCRFAKLVFMSVGFSPT